VDTKEKEKIRDLLLVMSHDDAAKRPAIEEIQKFLIALPQQWEINKQIKDLFDHLNSDKFADTNSSGIKQMRKIIHIKQPEEDMGNPKTSGIAKLALIKKEAKGRTGKLRSWVGNSSLIGAGRNKNVDLLYQKIAALDLTDPLIALEEINRFIAENAFVAAAPNAAIAPRSPRG
jgi:hypothetical protein